MCITQTDVLAVCGVVYTYINAWISYIYYLCVQHDGIVDLLKTRAWDQEVSTDEIMATEMRLTTS